MTTKIWPSSRIAHLVGLPARRKKADASRKNAESPPRRKVAKPRYVHSGSDEPWDPSRLRPATRFVFPTRDEPPDEHQDQAAIQDGWDRANAAANGRPDNRR
jgi:hypothetical protein